ncbi:hypothetical protein GF345_01445, partial [Candidatus Woesearchaeota archaeon]|nr:hypothetical protein [Candidatus Woesearchaeota archaeon]
MKFLFFGAGSIGKRHMRNIRDVLGSSANIIVYSHKQDKEKAEKLKKDIGAESFYDMDAAFDEKPDAVFITNPTSMHMEIALKAADKGIHIFMEKPVSHNMAHMDKLGQLIKNKGIVFFIGYDMRFNPVLKKLKPLLKDDPIGNIVSVSAECGSYLPDWRPEQDYTRSYSASKDMGGGVLLDLSHEIDYLIWLFGSVDDVTGYVEKRSSLEIDSDDNANLILSFSKTKFKGLKAILHLDYLQRDPSRRLKIVGEGGTIEADMISGKLSMHKPEKGWEEISLKTDSSDSKDPYVEELEIFLGAIKGAEGSPERVIGFDHGRHVMEVIEAALKSSRLARVVSTNEVYDKEKVSQVSEGKTIGIICARGGSKGVPGKNIKDLAGKPLIAYSIEEAKKSRMIDRLIVSTDDKKIAEVAEKYGAEVPFMRPSELATDTAGKIPAIQHAIRWLEDNEKEKVGIVVDIDPTSPLKSSDDINSCIR